MHVPSVGWSKAAGVPCSWLHVTVPQQTSPLSTALSQDQRKLGAVPRLDLRLQVFEGALPSHTPTPRLSGGAGTGGARAQVFSAPVNGVYSWVWSGGQLGAKPRHACVTLRNASLIGDEQFLTEVEELLRDYSCRLISMRGKVRS